MTRLLGAVAKIDTMWHIGACCVEKCGTQLTGQCWFVGNYYKQVTVYINTFYHSNARRILNVHFETFLIIWNHAKILKLINSIIFISSEISSWQLSSWNLYLNIFMQLYSCRKLWSLFKLIMTKCNIAQREPETNTLRWFIPFSHYKRTCPT